MAQLAAIPAHTQLLAVAWLRWRMFVNGFRRRQSGKRQIAGLIFAILLRLIIWPFLALLTVGPVAGCGFLAWYFIAQHQPQSLLGLLTGVFFLWQFVSLNGIGLSAAVPTFDASSLQRFPLRFGRYLLLRTLLGLLTPSTIVGCLALLAAVIGIGVADSSLALPALLVLAFYALMNIFFTRMLAAWLERWLANRRAREAFAGLTLVLVLGMQFISMRAGSLSAYDKNRVFHLASSSVQVLQWLPPGFAFNAIFMQGHPLVQFIQFGALLACTALFAFIFAIRLHKQFLGEYLSDGAVSGPPRVPSTRRVTQLSAILASQTSRHSSRAFFSPIIVACLRKEWLYLRGGANQIVSLLTPLLFIGVFSKGIFGNHPQFFLPGAIAYALLSILPTLYNVFGADGAGVQIYLLAPVRLRDVILAKNIASIAMIMVQATLAWILVLTLTKNPISPATQAAAALWAVFVIGSNLALGTLRSIQAPRRAVRGQATQMRTPTNRTSSLIVLAIFFGSILLQIPVTLLGSRFGQPWLGAMIFGPLAVAAIIAYALLLRSVDRLVLSHRDLMAEELCKT